MCSCARFGARKPGPTAHHSAPAAPAARLDRHCRAGRAQEPWMTSADTKLFKAADGVDLVYRRWVPDGEVRAALQIVHGASEHSGRYDGLAGALTDRGIAVYSMDLRGHGRTAQGTGVGRFGQGNAESMLDDVLTLRRIAANEHPGRPEILLGHSMGSVIALASAERNGAGLA